MPAARSPGKRTQGPLPRAFRLASPQGVCSGAHRRGDPPSFRSRIPGPVCGPLRRTRGGQAQTGSRGREAHPGFRDGGPEHGERISRHPRCGGRQSFPERFFGTGRAAFLFQASGGSRKRSVTTGTCASQLFLQLPGRLLSPLQGTRPGGGCEHRFHYPGPQPFAGGRRA